MTGLLLNHRIEGAASAPPLLLGPSLGTSSALWDDELADPVRYTGSAAALTDRALERR